MSAALAPPFIVASLVLCLAGALKLRSPRVAAGALRALGLPAGAWAVRGLAGGELALGAACAVHPVPAGAAALATAYGAFAIVAVLLRRRHAACGCFGADDVPVSRVQSIASLALACVAVGAAIARPGGLAWVLGRPLTDAAVLLIGSAGAVYAAVLVYTRLPEAWGAWGSR